jgi:DNA-binding winged helix-turn-helix (wHTH) protein/tetratricopeptide (TPR) repeat protein
MSSHINKIYEFGPFRLDVGERLLLREGQPIRLRSKVFDTLCVLVQNQGHLVGKETLMQTIWPETIVEENNLDHNISTLRRVLNEKKKEPTYIETVPKKGYRFVAEVREAGAETRAGTLATEKAAPSESSRDGSAQVWQAQLSAVRAEFAQGTPEVTLTAHGRRAPLHNVGRQKELAGLFRGFESAAAGHGALVCVAGEPGIGKTSLVEQFLGELETGRKDCTVVMGRCSERLAGSEAYLPILEALENLLRGPRAELLGKMMKLIAPTWYVQVAPLWASADASFAEVLNEAKTASRERMKREWRTLLEELAAPRPLVVFLDDLHWADVSTVEMLAYAARKLPSIGVMFIAAYRPTEMWLEQHPFVPVRLELQRQGVCRELALDLLSQEDVARYLSLELPGHDLPAELAGFIFERTEGSPLFMADLVRHLQERRLLTKESGQWKLALTLQAVERELPESVRSIVQKRIDQLSENDRGLLEAASVQGQQFDSAVIAEVLGREADSVERQLQLLERGHSFVKLTQEREFPDGTLSLRYGFVHVLHQNAIYDSLTPTRKTALSKGVAGALEHHFQDKRSIVALELALLYELARDFERASDYFLLAAEHASSLFANSEAVELAGRAMSSAAKLPVESRLPRMLAAANRSGQLHLTLSQMEQAILDFETAEKIAVESGDAEAQVNAICAAALARFNLKRMEETREQAGRALRIAQAAGSQVAAASSQLVLGLERLCFGATADAEQHFSQSVPVLRKKGPPLHALEAIGFAGLLHAWQLDYDDADRAVGWTLQHARHLGVPYHIIMNLFVRGMALFNQGRLSDGLNDLREGMRLAELNNERYWLSRYPNTLGWAYQELQELETAFELNHKGVRIAHENRYGKPEANSHLNLAHLHFGLGESQRALEHLRVAEQIFEADVWFRWRYNIRLKAEMARYWMKQGEPRKAAHSAEESLALAEPRKARKHMAWAHKLLGDVAVMEERFGDARREYEAALSVLHRYRCPIIEWKILLAAAGMASAYRNVSLAEHYRGRCQETIRSLADSITDDKLRRQFLKSEPISAALI